ncbi:MAG TPA: sulfatase-like hydrolase/transferase, partial [Terriglobia bacterium]|nr:sulfatase-like hydrolase/transferase [Terriglobia bacterium]
DTLRADRLSCYGYRGHATPHIDAIAKDGTLFSAIDSQVPLTLPSHTSLLTSTYPFSNGVEDNGEEVPAHTVTLASVLKAHGYNTAAFVGGFVLDRRFGLNQGFDLYDSRFDLHKAGGTDAGDIKRLGGEVVDSAIQWMQKNNEAPFFVFLHLYDLHSPYNLPPLYRSRFGTGYEAELQYVDVEIGGLWNFLSQNGLLKNTLVVFTADHGEGLGQHGESTHGYFIYQSTLWVPLIFHWPAEHEHSFPARLNAPAGLVDVAPTILQFLGISSPPQFQGKSLLGWLYSGKPQADREIFSESLYAHRHFGCSGLQSLRLGQYKYTDAPKPEFYDLQKDPGELHNLYLQKRSLALAYRERLRDLVARFKKGHAASNRALNPEALARLSSLGYASVSSPHSGPIAVGADPKDRIRAYEEYGRAVELVSEGRLQQSNAQLEQLLAAYPHLTDLRTSLGWNYQKIDNHAAAAKEFKLVLKEDPLNIIAHYDLGVSYFRLNQLQDAVKELQATLAIAPYYTQAENLLGTILLQEGKYDEAAQHFHNILKTAPDDYGANYDLGALAILNQQWEQAYQHLQAALRVEPKNPAAHNTMGSYYLRRGDLTSAQEEFAQSIQLDPNFARAHFNLGLVFLRQKQNEKASSEFQRALSIDPNLQRARDELNRLKSSQP